MATGLSRTDHVTLCALVRLVDAALAAPPADPLARTRIDSARLPGASAQDATPATPDPLDVAFLKRLPDITPYAFPSSPDADPVSTTEDKENDAALADAKGKQPRRSTVADPPDDRPSSPSASAASSRAPTPSVPPSPSRRSGGTPLESLGPAAAAAGGMRQRARRKLAVGEEGDVPAYLAAKRNKGKARLEQEEVDEVERARRAREALLPSDAAPSAGEAGSSSASDLVSQHHAVQASLLSSLTSLSGALKSSASEFGDRLARDRDVLERAREQLEKNEVGMGAQQARLKDVRGKSRGTTCWTLALLAAVAVLWVLLFLLIKVTCCYRQFDTTPMG
ncbi:hypothetical protein Rhopal_004400-T1 [Rhodotorula paludigena]|uniref:Uncharacterized protein n=1 Tax=Rhodotorula paludigena TaxID=86838 RepID=A0AAV5GN73_9BASI|nr:hypothetical protein Rhopal_004400-T1 [Rhodotorula paludigena]